LNQTVDTIHYDNWEGVTSYHRLEPRLSMRYILNTKSSLKAAFTRNYQNVHLASVSSVSLPTDTWVPSTSIIRPQLGVQYNIGYFRNFKNDVFETSVELYYKDMKNQIEYKDGALPEDNINDNMDNNFVFGQGNSYGAEFFIKKRKGKFNGWIGYTLSKTTRLFEDINYGEEFPAKYDRRHDISVVASYDTEKRWIFSAVFVFGTGNSLTMPVAWYLIDGRITREYGPRNSYRMEDYHRIDISATLKGKENKKFQSSWIFSVYNVYSRLNPYFIYFEDQGSLSQGSLDLRAKQVSLFPIIPSVTWHFKF